MSKKDKDKYHLGTTSKPRPFPLSSSDEPPLEFQTYICLVCHDDHSNERCKTEHVKKIIDSLRAENKELESLVRRAVDDSLKVESTMDWTEWFILAKAALQKGEGKE